MAIRHEEHTIDSLRDQAAGGRVLNVLTTLGQPSRDALRLASMVPVRVVAHDHAYPMAAGDDALRSAHLSAIKAVASGNVTTTSELLASSGEAEQILEKTGRALTGELAARGLIKQSVQSNGRIWPPTPGKPIGPYAIDMAGIYGRHDVTSADAGLLLPPKAVLPLTLVEAASKGEEEVRILYNGTTDTITSPGALGDALEITEQAVRKVAAEIGIITIPDLVAIDYSEISGLVPPVTQSASFVPHSSLVTA